MPKRRTDPMSATLPLFDLTGKVAVITGSSKGIGRAIAERMAEHGAKVVISSRKQDACDGVAAAIRTTGGEALARACNITRREEVEALVAAVIAEWGQIDILVCNAAANPAYGPLAAIDDGAMDKIFAANVKSIVWFAGLVAPQMAARGEGAILIISSVGGFIGSDVLGFYNMSKAAEQSLARSLAIEWGRQGVRGNCIAPGLVRTDFARTLWENPANLARITSSSALGRIAEPDEIAGAAIYLASRAGSFVTGQTIVVDGGKLIGASDAADWLPPA
jgi:NAD(P)-dependent dehydrogenase (short-subunit alcohol dehydrogenase family)